MQVTYATEPVPGQVNEDYVICGPDWWVVLDGATAPQGVDSGCEHDVRWLVEQLGAATAHRLTASDGRLADVLAEVIGLVREAHGGRCDLDNPDSPSATVSLLRVAGDAVEYLVLADSPIVLDTRDGVRVVVDDRLDRLPDYSLAGVRTSRNQPGGFWVASTKPEAAYQAVQGSVPTKELRAAAVLTDGASRYVERFGLVDWPGLMILLAEYGPAELIQQVRAVERHELAAGTVRRGKPHDDATAVLIRFSPRHSGESLVP